MKPPKDLDRYISPRIASARLITCAIQYVLMVRAGVRVRWELKIRYYHDPALEDPRLKYSVEMNSFHSGTEQSEDEPDEREEDEEEEEVVVG